MAEFPLRPRPDFAGDQVKPSPKSEWPDLHPATLSDEVYTPSPEALRRATRPTWGSLSEPRREQNLYANPKRTAKSVHSYLQTPQAYIWFKNFQFIFSIILWGVHSKSKCGQKSPIFC
jgi:hypothetical protein